MDYNINNIRSLFANRLRICRENKGLSQSELQKELESFSKTTIISKSTIGNQESGSNNPTLVQLHIYCDYFDVSTDYLIGRSNISKWPTIDEISKSVKKAISITDGSNKKVIAQKVLDILDINESELSESDKRILSIQIGKAITNLAYEQLL